MTSPRTHVFTSAALNYLGKVRALFRSVRRHHPEFVCHFLVVERREAAVPNLDPAAEAVDRAAFATDLAPASRPAWLFGHTLVELATAVKPHYALELLGDPGCGRVLYLDPDIVLFSRLDDVLEALAGKSIALTPHLLQPERERQAIIDNELCALQHGAFNLGFLGLSNTDEGRRFATWWRDRATEYCVDDLGGGLFTDQKWIDLAPALFDGLAVLRSPRLNVAPWNIGQRTLRGSFDEGFTVDGEPLGFYHFTGFDSGAHHSMLTRYAADNAAVQMLVDWYAGYTASLAPAEPTPWSLGAYDDGAPIADAHRRIYRRRPDLQAAFPDPYRTAGRSYRRWLQTHGVKEHPELLRR